jgi:hypothetical protein
MSLNNLINAEYFRRVAVFKPLLDALKPDIDSGAISVIENYANSRITIKRNYLHYVTVSSPNSLYYMFKDKIYSRQKGLNDLLIDIVKEFVDLGAS